MTQQLDAIAESQLVDGQSPNWEDQLRPASFRGVPFQVDTIEWTAGDNVVIREYPFQDVPTVFRMGAALQELKFSAYVIGPDYHLQRDALANALTGEGLLLHPTAGAMRVYVAGKFTMREAPTAEGGMARFDLHFVRADERRFPVTPNTARATAAAAAEAARTAAVASFGAQWVTAGAPGWVAEQAVQRVRASLDGVTTRLQQAGRAINGYSAQVSESYRAALAGLDALTAGPRQVADAVLRLMALPQDLGNAAARDFQGAFAWAFDLPAKLQRTAFESRIVPAPPGLVMYGSGTLAARAATPAQAQATDLAAASDRLFASLALAGWAEAAAEVEIANYDEALELRGTFDGTMRRLLQEASAAAAPAEQPAESWHDAMVALHTAGLADLQERSRALVRLTTYLPEGWQSVWYVSYRLFGTLAYADEILLMNPHIEHPMLVPPGVALRVMAR